MSVSEVGSRRRGVWQLGVDVRVRSRAERSWRVVGSEVLLPARVSRRRAALRVRLGAGGEPQHDSGGAAAVQSDAVLLGSVRAHRRPRISRGLQRVLPTAASAGVAALHG